MAWPVAGLLAAGPCKSPAREAMTSRRSTTFGRTSIFQTTTRTGPHQVSNAGRHTVWKSQISKFENEDLPVLGYDRRKRALEEQVHREREDLRCRRAVYLYLRTTKRGSGAARPSQGSTIQPASST